MRANGISTPVIFLTARDGLDDTVTGFGAGGDDYLTKPFHLKELVARIAAVLKRANGTTRATPGRLRCGRHRARRGDPRRVEPRRARRPLAHRVQAAALPAAQLGDRVSKAQILDHVWQFDFGGDASVVETYISTLRRKVDNGEPKQIRTVRGFGYVLRDEVAP